MLRYFFEDTCCASENEANRKLFYGLKIMDTKKAYTDQMGQYPIISLSFKSGRQSNLQLALTGLKRQIADEYRRHQALQAHLQDQAERFERIMRERGEMADYIDSIAFLSQLLYQVYGKKTIILIDEYDVPLEHAYFRGFYKEMTDFMRSLLESSLKTNPYLEFAVITGCLRITKESIFTGFNNLKMNSIINSNYDEHYGFTQKETDSMLSFYGMEDKRDTVKQWYDGYEFGETEVYNPWSVINYVDTAYSNKDVFPEPYWANTSSDSIVRKLIEQAGQNTRMEIEGLIRGESIEKPVHEEITYEDIDRSQDNLWNFLYFTGYLKKTGLRMEGRTLLVTMKIPNEEVRYIYENTIKSWFRDTVKVQDLSVLYHSILNGDSQGFQAELGKLLTKSISYMDNKEAFYHGFLLGLFENLKEYLISSNRESGNGRYDIMIRSLDVSQAPVILELKISDTFQGMEAKSTAALAQIEDKNYDSWLPGEGYTKVIHGGIAFYKKQCMVKMREKYFG